MDYMNDIINALFELGGVFMCLGHVKQIKKDRSVAGVYIPAVVFFSTWGYWNLIYYSSLNQWASLFAGFLLAITNTYWAILLYKYRTNK